MIYISGKPATLTKIVFLFFLLLVSNPSFSNGQTDKLFDNLKQELNNKHLYDQQKEARLQALKRDLNNIPSFNLQEQFKVSDKIYNEYKSYQYDSAYVYAIKLQNISLALHDKAKQDLSKIQIGFILLSSGMFKETFDNLHGIDARDLNDSVKVEYYSIITNSN